MGAGEKILDVLPIVVLAVGVGGFAIWLYRSRKGTEGGGSAASAPVPSAAKSGSSSGGGESSRKQRTVISTMKSKEWTRPAHVDHGERPTPRIKAARKHSKWRYASVRAEAEALRARSALWRDPEFPPDDSSLFKDPRNPPADWLRDGERGGVIQDATVQWKGPESFCPSKRPLGKRADGQATWLYSDADGDGVASCLDVSGLEVCQGSLGDCYLLCALAAATRDLALADDLIDEEFEDVGIYGVSFWTGSQWSMVWVDRNFPCYRPAKSSHAGRWRLIFASCEDPKEIWPLVVEKAYAKVHGSYEGLSGGLIVDALCALTGGRGLTFNMQSPLCQADAAWQIIMQSSSAEHGKLFVGAGSMANLSEAKARGIVPSHAYTVLGACEVEGARLLKLRNPWNRGEWKGAWSDGSKEWRSKAGRKLAQDADHSAKDDGEFWMKFEDFHARFQSLDFCDVSNEGREERLEALRASVKAAEGAGGGAAKQAGTQDDRSLDDLCDFIEGSKKKKNQPKKRK